jgi:hypothetical protein
MSFQGPGTGISGYSAQFTVGYANSAGNINGYAPQAGYANQGAATAANIQSAQGINGTSWAWSGQPGTPGWLWGANVSGQYAVWQPANITVGTANYTNGNIGGYAPVAGNINGYAPQAGYANQAAAYTNGNIGGYAPNSGYASYAGSAGNINGYAPSAGYAYSSGNASVRAWRGYYGNQYGVAQWGNTQSTTNFNVSLGSYYGMVIGRNSALGNVGWNSAYSVYTSGNPNPLDFLIYG